MIYPNKLGKGSKIAVTAPSGGITAQYDIARFESAKRKLGELGIDVVFGDSVFREEDKGTSVDDKKRGEEFNTFVEDKSVDAIISASGGDFMFEMIPYVDYDLYGKNPKIFQGYSDNTNLTFTLTTRTDVATYYSNNFGCFGMGEWHKSVSDNYEILTGKRSTLSSYDMYAESFTEYITGYEGFNLTKKTEVKCFEHGQRTNQVQSRGRVIGGCADIFTTIAGTKYENYHGFCDRYEKDGIILYLESFNANAEYTMNLLWRLDALGWFDRVNMIVFGRPTFVSSCYEYTYEEAVFRALRGRDVKVVMDADIGHKAPQFTMVNGAIADISVVNGKMNLTYEFV